MFTFQKLDLSVLEEKQGGSGST